MSFFPNLCKYDVFQVLKFCVIFCFCLLFSTFHIRI